MIKFNDCKSCDKITSIKLSLKLLSSFIRKLVGFRPPCYGYVSWRVNLLEDPRRHFHARCKSFVAVYILLWRTMSFVWDDYGVDWIRGFSAVDLPSVDDGTGVHPSKPPDFARFIAVAFELDWLLSDQLHGRRGLAWVIKLSLPLSEFQNRCGDLELESSQEQAAWLLWNLTVCLGYET